MTTPDAATNRAGTVAGGAGIEPTTGGCGVRSLPSSAVRRALPILKNSRIVARVCPRSFTPICLGWHRDWHHAASARPPCVVGSDCEIFRKCDARPRASPLCCGVTVILWRSSSVELIRLRHFAFRPAPGTAHGAMAWHSAWRRRRCARLTHGPPHPSAAPGACHATVPGMPCAIVSTSRGTSPPARRFIPFPSGE